MGKPTKSLSKTKSAAFLGRVSENVFGISRTKEKVALPSGYTVCYSRNGHPYLMKLDNTDAEDSDAANEHKRVQYPMSTHRKVLGEKFGVGIFLYFDFLLYLIATNFILFLLGCIAFGFHIYVDGASKNIDNYTYVFFSEDTWSESRQYWVYTNAVGMAFWFLFGPLYSMRVRSYFKHRSEKGADFVDLNNIEEYIEAEDYIRDNEHVTNRLSRMILSYFLYTVMLAFSCIIGFFLVVASVKSTNSTRTTFILSAIIAIFIKMMNMLAQTICVSLTRLEKHKTWSSFRTHNTLKFFLFKMLNVLIMYASRILTPIICPHIPKLSEYCVNANISCQLSTLGIQLMFILVLDLTVQNIWEIFYAWAMSKWKANEGMMGKGSNESVRPEFDVAEEYLEVLYRQLIIYFSCPIVPLSPILGMICNIVEYRLDKYRLLYLCQHPRGLQGSMKNFLTFFLFTTAAVAVASPPYGGAWVLSGTQLCPTS